MSKNWIFIFFAWVIAVTATSGSLYFSEIMHFVPCTLCWYQRIFMYPLILILFIGMIHLSKSVVRYATPLVIFGWSIALYHNLLQLGFITEKATMCVPDAPCTIQYVNYFNFLTIPMLSFIAFSLIAILLFVLNLSMKKSVTS